MQTERLEKEIRKTNLQSREAKPAHLPQSPARTLVRKDERESAAEKKGENQH